MSVHRLLDMGFEKEVKRFLEYLDKKEVKRQTVLVSATLSAGKAFITFFITRPVINLEGDIKKGHVCVCIHHDSK